MAFCPRCAAPNIDAAVVCSACGVPLSSATPFGQQPGYQAAPPPPQQPPPAYYPSYGQPKTSGYAIGGFACALGSLACGLACIPGLILSLVALSDIKKANGAVGGRGLAIAGVVISSAWMALMVIMLIIVALAPN